MVHKTLEESNEVEKTHLDWICIYCEIAWKNVNIVCTNVVDLHLFQLLIVMRMLFQCTFNMHFIFSSVRLARLSSYTSNHSKHIMMI